MMVATGRNWTSSFHIFYWIGSVMAPACVALILFFANAGLVYRFEHTRLPLSWAFAGVTVLVFLAAELCLPGSLASETEKLNPLDMVADLHRRIHE